MVTINGRRADAISVFDRGFAYGDGLFETALVLHGDAPLWAYHRARLRAGCARLGIAPDWSALEHDITALLAQAPRPGRAVLKVTVTRGVGGRGYRPPSAPVANRVVALLAAPAFDWTAAEDGVRLELAPEPLVTQPVLAGLKHLNRLEQVLAAMHAGGAERLLLDQAGHLVEATSSNLFMLLDGELVTPDLRRCGVAGVMRRLIIEQLAPGLGLITRIRDLPLDTLYRAEEVFVTNSLFGVRPVRAVGCHRKPIGSITRALQGALEVLYHA